MANNNFLETLELLVRAVVEKDVAPQEGREPSTHGEARGDDLQRDAVQVLRRQLSRVGGDVLHHQQGRQEVPHELAVRVPRRTLAVGVEGKRVDEDGTALEELDVESCPVLEDHPMFECMVSDS